MRTTCTRVSAAVLLLLVSGAAMQVGKDRIFVDQWTTTQALLFIADADGTNARKPVAGFERDYDASISLDTSGWCLPPSVTAWQISSGCSQTGWDWNS